MSLPYIISEPKHVIKNLKFLSISQIKLFENETNIVVTTDFCLYQIIKEPSILCAFDCTTNAGNISSRFLCLLPYPFDCKFAIGLRSKELEAASLVPRRLLVQSKSAHNN